MRREIINDDALWTAIDELLKGTSPALQGYLPALRVSLRRGLEGHESVRKARRRKGDPGWAQKKFAEGHTLHRFFRNDLENWEITSLLDDLKQIAGIAAGGGGMAREASAFLRGLAHCQDEIDGMNASARALLKRAETMALRARRYEALRHRVEVVTGSLVGTKCVSIDDIMKLGRKARNCLDDEEAYWKSFASGQTDVWSLRDGGRLVAVLQARQDGPVTEAFGPGNAKLGLTAACQVAMFCQAAGLGLEKAGLDLLPNFAESPLIARRVMMLKSRIALYAEWPSAVRIDLSGRVGGRRELFGSEEGPERTLTLAFDPRRSCAEEILDASDPRKAVERFGRKRLRRIVQSIAMDQTVPSLVQHRLLALAA